jgi:hypothetical protein
LGRGGHIAGDDRDASLEIIAVNVAASEAYEDGFAFDEGDAGIRAADGDAEANGADARTTIQDRGLGRPICDGSCEEDRVDPGPITGGRLKDIQAVAEERIVGDGGSRFRAPVD